MESIERKYREIEYRGYYIGIYIAENIEEDVTSLVVKAYTPSDTEVFYYRERQDGPIEAATVAKDEVVPGAKEAVVSREQIDKDIEERLLEIE